MLKPARAFVLFFLAFVFLTNPVNALETDQFTTPPHPLADFGPALRHHLQDCIAKTIETANGNRDILLRDAQGAPLSVIRQVLTDRADKILTPDYIAEKLYDQIGPGLPECIIEQWTVQATNQPGCQFAIRPIDSIYGNLFQRPITLQELSPTVNIYGVYLGTDKIGHLFQQGLEYYRVYRDEENRGRDPRAVTAAAVRLGISQERGFYGEAMVGVYSNGDLAANFAGLQFYLNLTRPLEIRGQVRPPILLIRDGHWVLNPRLDPEFLSLFISDHMNESLNVCRYMWYMRDHVRLATAQRGARWAAFYHTTYERQVRVARELTTWFGQDYGHCGMADVFTAAEVCFPHSPARQFATPFANADGRRGS